MMFFLFLLFLGAFVCGWVSSELHHTLTAWYGLREDDRQRDQWLAQQARDKGAA